MNGIKEWITTILIAAFIINLIDLILPSGSLKTYVNLVLSFIFVFIIIAPVANNFVKDMTLEDRFLKEFDTFQYDYKEKLISLDPVNQDELKENYTKCLKESITTKLKEYGYELENMEIDNNEVKNIVIKESKYNKNSNNEGKEEIEFKRNENYKETFKEKEMLKEKFLKDELNKIFEISIEKIEIN